MVRRCRLRNLFVVLALVAGGVDAAGATATGGFSCGVDAAWTKVRETYPLHSQILAACDGPQPGQAVVVLTEPPPHLTRNRIEPVVRALFSSPVLSVERRRHPLGYGGWVEDLVLVVGKDVKDGERIFRGDLAYLSGYAFGSTYKAEVLDIARMGSVPDWSAPPPVEVRAEELAKWLLGPKAISLVPSDGGDQAPLELRAGRKEVGTYFTTTRGLVVALVPRIEPLNDHAATLRRFAVDTDAVIGAINLDGRRLALIGRERTTSTDAMPPLRVETILLLAASGSQKLEQSYERGRPFAGKLLTGAGDLFGWDWAPILLSDDLVDTEYGGLLNLADNMLKWLSQNGDTEYQVFRHARPRSFPFGNQRVVQYLDTADLTFNWNTAGFSYITRWDGIDILAVRSTGSLPVSYIPGSGPADPRQKARLMAAEDKAYRYFSTLRDPVLARSVQYASLYQIFQAFSVQARRPHEAAPAVAEFRHVESMLADQVSEAVRSIPDASKPLSIDPLLHQDLAGFGVEARSRESLIKENENDFLREVRDGLAEAYHEIGECHSANGIQDWVDDFARRVAEKRRLREDLPCREEMMFLRDYGIKFLKSSEAVRQGVLKETEREPKGWIRTPSIVVSHDPKEPVAVGGHNIGGRATRVVIDSAVAKGEAAVFGSYAAGRELHLNPADAARGRELVREFDRAVGVSDRNLAAGKDAVKAKLGLAPPKTEPIRSIPTAVKAGRTDVGADAVRGAEGSPNAMSVGLRPDRRDGTDSAALQAIAKERRGDIVVRRSDDGYLVYREFPAPPGVNLAPNEASMLEAVDRAVQRVIQTRSPPPGPRVLLVDMGNKEAELQVASLAKRMKAVQDGGGQPPFGGDRGPFMPAEGPDPMRPFSNAEQNGESTGGPADRAWRELSAWERLLVALGLRERSVPLEVVGNTVAVGPILKGRPDWSMARFKFPPAEGVSVVGGTNPLAVHVVEIEVPVTVETADVRRPEMRFTSWFHRARTPEENGAINREVEDLLKARQSSVEDALRRYKLLMIEKYGAERVEMEIRSDIGQVHVTVKIGGGPDHG